MASATRQITLRRPDRCAACSSELAVGERAIWDPTARQSVCLACEQPQPERRSVPGASAARKHERLRDARKARARERYGALGAAAATINSGPQHERAWARGAEGEAKLARTLEQRTADHGVVLLHDRRVPGSRANIDHIAISRPGVLVIDAKRYSGRIAVERRGGLLSPRTSHLIVGGRDQTKLVDGVLAQAEVVSAALVAAGHAAVPVLPVLCFVDGDWPFMPRLEVRGVPIIWPRQTAKLCCGDGPLNPASVETVADEIARRLPAA
jgi:hypothetical protein